MNVSADPPSSTFAARGIFERARRRFGGEDPDVIIIDGRSGSGKSTLARAVLANWGNREGARPPEPSRIPDLLHVEDLYPGWSGLAEGSATLPRVLEARAYRAYDWNAGEFGGRSSLDATRPLVIEGCGAITSHALRAAARWRSGRVWTIWVECDEPVRQARALARDGDAYLPHWESWAAQELAHIGRHSPVSRARQIVHTTTPDAGRLGGERRPTRG